MLLALLRLLITTALLKSVVCDTFYIVPTSGGVTGCPVSAGVCYTLHEYATSPVLSSNITLQLLPGNHSLNTTLSLTSSVVNFAMTSDNGMVICGRSPNTGSITFDEVQTVHVGQLNFVDCYTRVRMADSLTVEDVMFQGGDSIGFQVTDVTSAHFRQTSFIAVRGSAIVITGSTVNVDDCDFVGNGHTLRHGGAITITQSQTLTITNSKFIENSAGVEGGGVYSRSSRVDINGCNFTRNVAKSLGGAVSIQESGGSVWHSDFLENTAGDVVRGGGTGGAIHNAAVFDSTNLEIHYSTFVNNAAGDSAGAVFIRTRRHFDVTNSMFQNNSAFAGGAIQLYKNHHVIILSVINCTFSNNRAILKPSYSSNPSNCRGGALFIRGGIRCIGSNFTDNSALYYGGVAYMYDDSNDFYSEQCSFTNNSVSIGSGGVLYGVRRETIALVVDSTFTRNSAPSCGVADILSITEGYHNNFTVISSRFYQNSATDNSSDAAGLGGVGCVKNGSIDIVCSTFDDNRAAQNGGVLYANESTITTSQSLFLRNSAANDGGVMYISHSSHSISDGYFVFNSAENNGGALFIIQSSGNSSIHNTLFSRSSAGQGGALFVTSSALTITQTNFRDNIATTTAAVVNSCDSLVTITGATDLQMTTDSTCTHYDGDISQFNVTVTFSCPYRQPDLEDVTYILNPPNLPVIYNAVVIEEELGLGDTCLVDQRRREALESIRSSVQKIVQNAIVPIIPSLTSNEPRNKH